MDWTEKLRHLLQGRNAAQLAATVDLPRAAFSNAMNGEQMPRADKAVKMAKALGVPAEWLFDDSQSLPPPSRPSLPDLTDQAVMEDLIRRRTQAIEDIRLLSSRLAEPGRLARCEAAFTSTGNDQFRRLDFKGQAEVKACTYDIRQQNSAELRLAMLDPVKHGPSTDGIAMLEKLLAPHPQLAAIMAANIQENSPLPPFNKSGEMDPTGRIVPSSSGHGSVIDRVQYAEIGPILQRFYVPVVTDPANGPPAERPITYQRGQTPPERYSEFVKVDTPSPRAFALRISDQIAAAGSFKAGSIIVCDPEAEISGDVDCVVVFSDRPNDWRIARGAVLLKERPELQSAKGRDRLAAKVFPIADIFNLTEGRTA